MPLVKYTANADPHDGTGAVKLESTETGQERVITLKGDPLEVTADELNYLRGRHVVVEVDEHGHPLEDEPDVVDLTKPSVTPVTPTPTTPGASGSTPSSPTPGQGS